MPRIELREEAARPTPLQPPDPANYGASEAAYAASSRANQFLATSIGVVGKTFNEMFEHGKAEDIESDAIAANAKRIEVNSSKMQTLQEELDNGQWQNKDAYQQRLTQLLDESDKEMEAWGKDNMRWNESLTRLYDVNKLERARNLAAGMGTFLNVNAKRTVERTETALKLATANMSREQADGIIDTMTWLSPEQRNQRKVIAKQEITGLQIKTASDYIDSLQNTDSQRSAIVALAAAIKAEGDGEYDGLLKANKENALNELGKKLTSLERSNLATMLNSAKEQTGFASNDEAKNFYTSSISDFESSPYLSEAEKKQVHITLENSLKSYQFKFNESVKKQFKAQQDLSKKDSDAILAYAHETGDLPGESLSAPEASMLNSHPKAPSATDSEAARETLLLQMMPLDLKKDLSGNAARAVLVFARANCNDADFKVVADALHAKRNGIAGLSAEQLKPLQGIVVKNLSGKDKWDDLSEPEERTAVVGAWQDFLTACDSRGVKTVDDALKIWNEDSYFKGIREAAAAGQWFSDREADQATAWRAKNGTRADFYGRTPSAQTLKGSYWRTVGTATEAIDKLSKNLPNLPKE